MSYQHRWVNNLCELPTGKVVCVGRNYAEHAKELNNPIPSTPMLFIKPATSVVGLDRAIEIPQGKGVCHHELEVSAMIGETLSHVDPAGAKAGIVGYGLGLDLTLRDLQQTLKAKGHPWEVAKAFDGACPLSPFVPAQDIEDPENLDLTLIRNGQVQQRGNTSEMITGIYALVAYMSSIFTLHAGDVIMTGTPAGVGPLMGGDQLTLRLADQWEFTADVAVS